MEVEEAAEADDCGDFIDDSSSSCQEPTFYREVNNYYLNSLNEENDDESDWLIDKNAQVENYTVYGITNPEHDEFKDEKQT